MGVAQDGRCERCGSERTTKGAPREPRADADPPEREPGPAAGDDPPTHCEWCGAEYPVPDAPA